ncbi:DNA-protecting protein DprA [bacterium]|nr:DNA-protecting protein DprA [bacterium]
MSHSSLVHRIALGMIPGVGDITARKLVSYAGGVDAVFSESFRNLTKIPGVGETLAKAVTGHEYLDAAAAEAEFVEKHGIKVFFYLDDDYPARLRQCEDSPVTFYLRGNADLNAQMILSVVGTRHATQRGRELCQAIIAGLAEHFPGLVIISGLAYGIDIAAHKAAMAAGLPTAAVLGHGLKTIYPSVHAGVARAMLNNGAHITDFSSSTLPERNNFIRRNRIIAGISDATLIIESGIKGGALITADIASSYNRDVMAVPGRPGDEWSAGCNALIRCNKAALVEKCEDIEYLLGWKPAALSAPVQKTLFTGMTDNERRILEALKDEGELTMDAMARMMEMPVYRLSTVLLQMELAGLITPCPGSVYRIRG